MSVVESADACRSSPKSVVASTSGSSITIGFNVKIDAADSDDTDSVIDKTNVSGDTSASASNILHVVPLMRETFSPSEDIVKHEDCCVEDMKTPSSEQIKERLEIDKIVTATPKDECEKMTEIEEEERVDQNDVIEMSQFEKTERDYCDENKGNQSNVTMDSESATTTDRVTEAIANRRIVYTSTKELQVPAYSNEDTLSISVIGDKASNAIELSLDNTSELNRATSEELSTCTSRSSASTAWTGTSLTRTTELHSQEQPSTSVQKHKSSLERLLSLFQHPGQLFSDSSSAAVDTRNSLQESVSGVMALGDRVQQYLKEGRTKIDGSWSSSEHGSPLKNKSIGMNISQLQNLTGIFASFKLEPQVSLVEHGAKFFGQMKNQDTNIRERNLEETAETEVTRVYDERNLLDRETNQLVRNDGNSLIEQDQMIKNENNLFDQKRNDITKDEKDFVSTEKNQIIRRDDYLFDQENSRIPKNDEQKLLDQISRDDEKDFISQEESQVSNSDENKLLDRIKSIEIDERNLGDWERSQEIVGENFQKSEYTQGRDEVANDNSEDERLRNDVARNDGKESASVRNNEKESDGISDRLLPESVQSKDDFADNLVLNDVCVATNAAVVLPSLPASESIACINVRLTDVVGCSALGLSQIADICVDCNDAKRFEDLINEKERDVPQDLKHTERGDDTECLRCDDSEILGNNDAKCLQRDNDAEERNAAMIRTCDTTTDSINQTSDSRFFSISNIAYDNKKAVDSVSIASITTDDDVDVIGSVPGNNEPSSMSSTSLKDASVYLNEEVTINTRRACRCDFTSRKEGEDLHDDAYRDFVDRATSTSINIKIDPHGEAETTSPGELESQEVLGGRLFMSNNVDKHRIILETAAEAVSHPEDDDERNKRTVDPTILVTLSPHETSVDKSDAEELIFCMTDLSTDGMSIEDELSPQAVASRSSPNKLTESYFELPASRTTVTTSTSSSTLLIENPGSLHRNSQDSGIEEIALTIDEIPTVVGMTEMPPIPPPPPPPPPPLPPPPRSSLQESVDSGIESECSSICIRMESATSGISTLEMIATPKRPTRDNNDDDEEEFGEFASDFLARETRLVDSDSTSGDGGVVPYLKCAVVGTTRPVADEGVARPAPPIIAHSPAAVHGTR